MRTGAFRVFRQRESLDNSGMSAFRRRTLRIAFGVIAGLIAGAATAATIILLGASVFWLYLFGDDPWPSSAEIALVASGYVAGAIVFLAIVISQARARG